MANEQITPTDTTATETVAEIDYKAEYERVMAERDSYKAEAEKQRGLKDQYSRENADYKRKAQAQMTDEEKRAEEMRQVVERATRAEEQLAQMRLEKSGLESGFTAEEVKKLIEGKFSFADIKAILTARVEEAVKSARAEAIKGSTASELLGSGSADGAKSKQSDYQTYQNSKQKQDTVVKL